MQSAALFLLASSMGVLFGWQPMPDGSPRYEYVVQLDPDLVATLEAGQSIPISTDIPEDIQPIGRIRIVVGREPLPRTRLSTSLRQAAVGTEKKSRAGLVETQHRVSPVEPSGSGRYGNTTPQSILPPGGNTPRVAQAPQNGSQPANNSSILPPQDSQGIAGSLQGATQQLADQFRNNSQLRNVGESVRTDAQQLFGEAGNNAVSGVLGQVGNTADQLRQGFQQGVEPLRQVAEQTGQQLRGAVDGIGQRAREVVDQFGRPLREQSILSNRQDDPQSILPPGSTTLQQNFAGNQANPRGQRLDQPVSPQRDNWQASPWKNSAAITPGNTPAPTLSPPAAQSTTTNPRGFNAPWPALPRDENRNQASQQSPQSPPWPNKTPSDRFDLANHPTANQPTTDGGTGGRYNSNNNWPSGPSFPASKTDQPPNFASGDRNSQQPPGATASSAPGISRDMLDRPADAPLQTAVSQPSKRPPQAADFGWDDNSRRVADNSSPQSEDPTRAVFPLVLSWVLLSGSGAGNLYLFWSFWDVRNKYRGLVHNTRSSGSRY